VPEISQPLLPIGMKTPISISLDLTLLPKAQQEPNQLVQFLPHGRVG